MAFPLLWDLETGKQLKSVTPPKLSQLKDLPTAGSWAWKTVRHGDGDFLPSLLCELKAGTICHGSNLSEDWINA